MRETIILLYYILSFDHHHHHFNTDAGGVGGSSWDDLSMYETKEKTKYIDLSHKINAIQVDSIKEPESILLQPLNKIESSSKAKFLNSIHSNWRPEGNLVFSINTVDDPVTAIASDNCNFLLPRGFLLAGTKGGFLKLWDIRKMEKHGTSRARLICPLFATSSKPVVCIRYCGNCLFSFVASNEGGFVGLYLYVHLKRIY